MNSLQLGPVLHDEELRYEQLVDVIEKLAPEEGIRHLKSFLITYPSFAAAHNDLGVLYLRAGNGTLALAHHEKATRLQPENILFRKNLADFYAVELGWLEDAADIYLEVLRRNPRDIEAMMALGKLGEAMNSECVPSSRLSFDSPSFQAKIVNSSVSPENGRSMDEWYNDALLLAGNGNAEAAIAELKGLADKYPENALVRNDLAILLQKQEKYTEAREYLEQAVDIDPKNPLYRKNLADILYVGFGDMEAAMRHYVNLLSAAPRDIDVLRAIAHICIDCGKLEDSVIFMERILEVQPWDQEVREAIRKIKGIISAPVSDAAPAALKTADEIYAEAKKYLEADQVEEARNSLAALVLVVPDNPVAHNDLGVVSVRLGNYADAQRHYERAVELVPENSNFRKNLADLYFTCLGRTDDAIFIYLELLKVAPRDIETLINLGHICSVINRPDEAKIFYRRAVEIEPWNRDAREALQSLTD